MKGESMSYSLFIASRYLTSRSKRTFISIISFMSVLGVAIGVAALVIVMSVYNGVTEEMREKILGANPHVMVMATQAGAFGPEAARGEGEVIERIRETPGVVSATPFLYAEVLLSTPQGATGLVVRGIDPVSAGESMPLLHHLESGSVEDLVRESGPAGMIVGHDLARRFNLRVGSRVNLMSPAGQRTTAGFVPKLRSFRVVGVFKSGMSDFDSRLAYVSLGAAQDLMGYPDGHVSGVEAFVKNPYDARDIARDVAERLGPPFYSRNWIDMNANLFAALQLERFGMFIVLLMVILVGSFSIITSLVMLVMEKDQGYRHLDVHGSHGGGRAAHLHVSGSHHRGCWHIHRLCARNRAGAAPQEVSVHRAASRRVHDGHPAGHHRPGGSSRHRSGVHAAVFRGHHLSRQAGGPSRACRGPSL